MMSSVTFIIEENSPNGACSTKPRSTWTGPPNMTGWSAMRLASMSSDRSMRSNSVGIIMSVGLLMMTPSAPSSLCSHM